MANYLVIVESPAKASTIKKILGNKYNVIASMGHVRDLPKSQLGIDVDNNYEPKYINIRGKAELIKKLKKEASASKKVYLATDPDREGEAIAWHLAYILGIDNDETCRITFNEITKHGILSAIEKPRKLDMDLINAQQARRELDRIVGYKISPLLWKKVKKGLSAGRVQSVTVRLIVDREEEIEKFIPEEYWSLEASLKKPKDKKAFNARLVNYKNKKIEIHSEEEMNKILSDLEGSKYIVKEIKYGEKKRNPAPPFTTSTMQQEASRKLGFAIKKTMSVAQTLYESGLITYMRTDSTRISDEARSASKEQIIKQFGKEYYENRYYKTKKDAQDAHEAIRPTYIDKTPAEIKDKYSSEQYKLYKLIYERLLASQMSAAIYDTMAVDIDAGKYTFRSNGSKIRFAGFMALYVEGNDENLEEKDVILPELEEGKELDLRELLPEQHFTEPPARYTEASLVKALEERGIGRPSTYAPTITTIIDRRYVEREKKLLHPTELGKIVDSLLKDNFQDIVDVEFTAQMEEKLDWIAEGDIEWKKVIGDFYVPFRENLEEVEERIGKVELKDEVSDIPCEKCGRMMVYKIGRYGKFLACPGFPECRNIKPIVQKLNIPCPKCGAEIHIRKSKRGKKYYICEHNPDTCDFIAWNGPDKNGVIVAANLDEEKKTKKTEKKSSSKKDKTKTSKAKTTKTTAKTEKRSKTTKTSSKSKTTKSKTTSAAKKSK
ncbi:MAG: type I DNA topoisomerase [Clostridia bacterium]|nr:type I DNA topoisomerase [Clostridia bacterium]